MSRLSIADVSTTILHAHHHAMNRKTTGSGTFSRSMYIHILYIIRRSSFAKGIIFGLLPFPLVIYFRTRNPTPKVIVLESRSYGTSYFFFHTRRSARVDKFPAPLPHSSQFINSRLIYCFILISSYFSLALCFALCSRDTHTAQHLSFFFRGLYKYIY